MNVDDGEILAMGSAPTFDPVDLHPHDHPAAVQGAGLAKNDAPLANRAIQGLYPTGSVFKPITAAAALAGGHDRPQVRSTTTTARFKLDVLN